MFFHSKNESKYHKCHKKWNKTDIIRYKKNLQPVHPPFNIKSFQRVRDFFTLLFNVLRGIRTPDRRLRRPLLYPAELSGQMALFFQQPNTILCLNRLFVNGFL